MRISKNDYRYTLLKKRPQIKQLRLESISNEKTGMVWFKTSSGKFLVIQAGYMKYYNGFSHQNGYIWEMSYNCEKKTILI
jgi:hypothetical protein